MFVNDTFYMQQAICLAKRAGLENEIPVGALLVKNNNIISEGWNQSIQLSDPTAHAEVMAIRKAGQQLNNYRLLDTTLYVTLEPCIMCVGVIIQARIKRLVFAAYDDKTGCVVSRVKFFETYQMNHIPEVTSGVLGIECSQMLSDFFTQKRENKNN